MRKRRLFCSFSPSVHTQTLIQRFRKSPFSSKTETFENGFESGDFWKRCVVVWRGENRDFWKRCWFENVYVWTCPIKLHRIVFWSKPRKRHWFPSPFYWVQDQLLRSSGLWFRCKVDLQNLMKFFSVQRSAEAGVDRLSCHREVGIFREEILL